MSGKDTNTTTGTAWFVATLRKDGKPPDLLKAHLEGLCHSLEDAVSHQSYSLSRGHVTTIYQVDYTVTKAAT